MWIVYFILLLALCVYMSEQKECYVKDKKKKPKNRIKIGDAKMVKLSHLSLAIPLIVPFRAHTRFWSANVPLTPFRAPYLKLPPLPEGETLPNFLLYDPDVLCPVRNQGECGACWAFALTDTMSDRLAIETAGLFQKNISVQQLLDCFNPNGCDGGSPEEAALWLSETKKRLTMEKNKPFKSGKGSTKAVCEPSTEKTFQVGVKEGEVYSLAEFVSEFGYDKKVLQKNVENMKMELYQGGPFYCAMAVYDDLFTYAGTRPYKRRDGAQLIGGHAIQIIGYCEKGVDKRKGYEEGYWFCRNSWGKEWPVETVMSGYFTVPMGVNMCGIESRCGVVMPTLYGKNLLKGKKKSLDDIRYTNIRDYYN